MTTRKAQAGVTHEKLADGEEADRMKGLWREGLNRLKARLEG